MISPDRLLPDVITEFPGTREVFDRYGLHGCGGARGPHETVEFFAKVHGVPLRELLRELEAARGGDPVVYEEALEDRLYRRFFRGAIGMFVGVGGLLGVTLLVLQAFRVSAERFWAITQAHGDVQLFGWIGLFVMGFACQGLPRFKFVKLWRPAWASRAFGLVVAGLLLRVVAVAPGSWALGIGVAGSILVALGAVVFGTVMFRTLAAATSRDPWDRYVTAGVSVFVIGALMGPFFLLGIAWTPWIAAWRDVLLLGFGGLVVLGVGQRIMPAAFGFRAIGPWRSRIAFVLTVVGVAVIAAEASADRPWIATATAIFFGAGALALGAGFGVHAVHPAGRSTKFLRAAWVWMAVAVLLLASEGPLNSATGYSMLAVHSAFRHAFALGFLSLTIVGVSLKVVPVLGGIDPHSLPELRGVFALMNGALVLRIVGLISMESGWAHGLHLAAVSGPLTLAAFAIWGWHMLRLMKRAPAHHVPVHGLGPDTRVAEIAGKHPESLEVFDRFGFRELRNPLLRATLARGITVRMACGMKGVDMEEFLRALREKGVH